MDASVARMKELRRGSRMLAVGAFAFVAIAVGVLADAIDPPAPTSVDAMAARPVVMSDGRTIFVQKHEVTVAEWNRCHAAGACALQMKSRQRDDAKDFPATGVNWFDVQEYLAFINRSSAERYRLPSSAEWNWIAREVLPEKADPIFTDPELRWASRYLTTPETSRKLRPSGSFKTTSDGIADLDGSVWEWTGDCYADPDRGFDDESCPAFIVGGEHLAAIPVFTRDPARGGCAVGSPPPHLGLRLVSDTLG